MNTLKWVLVCVACAFALNLGLFLAGMVIGYFQYVRTPRKPETGVSIVYVRSVPMGAWSSAPLAGSAAPAPSPSL